MNIGHLKRQADKAKAARFTYRKEANKEKQMLRKLYGTVPFVDLVAASSFSRRTVYLITREEQ